ncbi:PspC domain-containing protein [Pontibacter diazotrophicus]|uniref:PspC domain-containing protein n=1 Tax=Pontibacter diazotrophicus TaxID=1400979 RepID=A0A3D8LFQ5_9BACT|nr:PspC domain-containing protein [Pontibacter diazotrophicus]RDV15752.1 PspC domain-containing protein [Pontibacter diazotrophicus]
MKKNISINLQGIIFHIEEDGYEQLSRYLASIRTYFSNYEGHEEIVADIEARIAEIFSARLSPGKQVISQEDVEYLIGRMGSVTDFEVLDPIEEGIPNPQPAPTAYEGAYEETYDGAYGTHETSGAYTAGPKKLFRDVNRKVIAGVASGLANYLNADPLWVRLFFVLLVLLGIASAGISAATGIILYVVLWIAMPENDQLPETTARKLFRDPEDKKLAGVASGIAKYFGVDTAVIRVLFIALIFAGGFGIIAYIVLWVAMPEAVTLSERLQMQGDPVTLAGIEKTLKDNLNMKDSNGEESQLAKVILLPFRLISQLFNWLGKALGPIFAFLITLIRIGAGVILLVVSIGLTIALFSTFFVSLGLVDDPQFIFPGDFPASVYLGGFPRLGLVAGFFVGLIPLLLLIILSVSLLVKRTFLRPFVGWSLFAVWLVSLFTMIATIAMHSTNFRRSGEVVTSKTIPVANYGTLTLDAYDTNTNYDNVYIDVRAHNSDNIEIIQRAEAKGRTEEEAKQNASMITYRVVQQDSTLRFDNSYEFRENAAYRDQELSITLMLPQDKPLRLTRAFTYLLPSASFAQSYSVDKIVRNTWQASGDQLECLTCAADTLDTEEADSENLSMDLEGISGSVLLDEEAYSSNARTFDFDDFSEVTVSGPYHVQIKQGSNYSIRVRGEDKELRLLSIEKSGQELRVRYAEENFNLFDDRNPVLIQIVAPDYRSIDLSGAIKADIGRISSDDLQMNFAGAIRSTADVNVRNLKVDIAGASISKFTGRTESFELDATGAGVVDADGLQAASVDADVTGASAAQVYATNKLRAQASGASRITYRGNPSDTTIDSNGPSSVKRR